MAVEKFSISLPRGLAEQLDELARTDGSTRSSLIREATARYVTSRTADAEAQRHRASVGDALEGFDEVASLWGDDDRPGVEYLADIRDTAGPGARPEGPSGE